MLEYVTLRIDGTRIHAPRGTSALQAALEYGICIPHLCYLPTLSATGACRLCIVEVIKNGHSRVTTSCTLDVQEGMIIEANSEKIKKLRRNIAELLVAEAPDSRAIQDIALRCGVKQVRYPFHNSSCVQCGRCVRACGEMWRAKALGFVGRGKNRRVGYAFDSRTDFCKRCHSCIDLCPMTLPPCRGSMKAGEEYFCARCESQLSEAENSPGSCVWCQLGKNFQCSRQTV